MKNLKKMVMIVSAISLLGLGACSPKQTDHIQKKGWVSKEEPNLPERAYKKLANTAVDLAVDLDDNGTPDKEGYKKLFENLGLNYDGTKSLNDYQKSIEDYIAGSKTEEICEKVLVSSNPLFTEKDGDEFERSYYGVFQEVMDYLEKRVEELDPVKDQIEFHTLMAGLAVDLDDDGMPDKEGYKKLFEGLGLNYESEKTLLEYQNIIGRFIENKVKGIETEGTDANLFELRQACYDMFSIDDVGALGQREDDRALKFLEDY